MFEAWLDHPTSGDGIEKNPISDDLKAFYEYHSTFMEPWDGPAAIAFTDGRQIGATLDRNGLRPSRYIVTADDLVVMASESGVLPIDEGRIIKKWRLQPGKMFLIDLEQGRLIHDEELKNQFASAKPYRQWIENVRVRLNSIQAAGQQPLRSQNVFQLAPRLADEGRCGRRAARRWGEGRRLCLCDGGLAGRDRAHGRQARQDRRLTTLGRLEIVKRVGRGVPGRGCQQDGLAQGQFGRAFAEIDSRGGFDPVG